MTNSGVLRGSPRGLALTSAIAACSLWGISAVAVQVVLDNFDVPPEAVIATRMPVAGLILYAIFRPARPKELLGTFLVFAFCGLWMAQITYFVSIAYSNAATGSLLSFLCLPMIAGYEYLRGQARVTVSGLLAVAIAMIGATELVAGQANGSLALVISPIAVAGGLGAAAASAYYIIASKRLLKAFGTVRVTTWGFLFGSFAAFPVGIPSLSGYRVPAVYGGLPVLLALVCFVIVGGSLTSFLLYFKGLEHITPTEAGIISAMEPIIAAVASYFLLRVVLTPWQYFGGVLIVGAVAIIVLKARLPF